MVLKNKKKESKDSAANQSLTVQKRERDIIFFILERERERERERESKRKRERNTLRLST